MISFSDTFTPLLKQNEWSTISFFHIFPRKYVTPIQPNHFKQSLLNMLVATMWIRLPIYDIDKESQMEITLF